MSEKRSWDIQPKRKAPAAPTPAPPVRAPVRQPQRATPPRPAPRPQERPMPELKAQVVRRQPAVSKVRGESLKTRRKRAKRRSFVTVLILFLIIIAGGAGSLWLPAIRIQNIEVAGPDSAGMQTIAQTDLAGTYHYVFPRNSIFFFPEEEIRNNILAQYPDISAVAISRASFTTISQSQAFRVRPH